MKKIPLTQNKFALVDDEDYEWLNQWKWHVNECGGIYYARRCTEINYIKKNYYMHREIMMKLYGDINNFEIDHIDSNRLNNQKDNLRLCNRSQNLGNRNKSKNNKSGFKGVIWDKKTKKWLAQTGVNYKHKALGYFTNIMDAAKTYDKFALEYYGKFARLNFPLVRENEQKDSN